MKMKSRGLDTMDGFLIRLLVPIYIVISLSLVISHAKAIEPPRSPRQTRQSARNPLKVTVKPVEVELYPNEEVSIKCRARGGRKIKQTPYITFYREIQESLSVHVSSSNPGVIIQSVPTEDQNGDSRVANILKLGPAAYNFLDMGPNIFYCRANDMSKVHVKSEYFSVVKMPTPRKGKNNKTRRRRHKKRRSELSVIIQ